MFRRLMRRNLLQRKQRRPLGKQSLLVKKTTYMGGAAFGWDEYEYDASGNQTKTISYSSDGAISSWTEYEYAAFGG